MLIIIDAKQLWAEEFVLIRTQIFWQYDFIIDWIIKHSKVKYQRTMDV